MNSAALQQCNIDNLTSLWREMGIKKDSAWQTHGLTVSARWPNRYWFDWTADLQQVNAITATLDQMPTAAVVPVWMGAGQAAHHLEMLLKDADFQLLFTQQVMYLDLQTYAMPELPAPDIKIVQSLEAVKIWVAIASAAFATAIDIAAINAIVALPEVKLLLLQEPGQAVGTALIYQTRDIVGVHLVGVPEPYRGRGFARVIMQQVIKLSIAMGGKYLTLQASTAGAPLYLQLGFVAQSWIHNYRRIE